MLIFSAFVAAVSTAQAPAPAAPERQAQAMVRILSSAPLRFSQIERDQPQRLRESMLRRRDGSTETLRLVEFE